MARPKRDPGETRRLVGEGLRSGLSRSEIARRLGVSKPTVTYHARRLGEGIQRPASYDWEAIQRAHDGGMRAVECRREFGFSAGAWSDAIRRGAIVPNPHVTPMADLLVDGRQTGRGHLKRRLIREGLKDERCEACGLTEWRGRPVGFALHHVNGVGTDNRLENLQILCPNCHAQTPNFSGRNRGARAGD